MTFEEYKKIVHAPKLDKIKRDRIYRVERSVSARLSWFIVRFIPWVQPNHVTIFSLLILFVVFLISAFAFPNYSASIAIIQLLLLYSISITDRIDGEIARAKNHLTQQGVYLDRAVHFLYPLIFYFIIGSYFLALENNFIAFSLTILLGLLSQQLIFFNEARLSVGEALKKQVFTDLLTSILPEYSRSLLPIRLLDYLTFMIYSLIPFFYILIIGLSTTVPTFAFVTYFIHIVFSLLVIMYKVFVSYPRHRLFSLEEAEQITSKY